MQLLNRFHAIHVVLAISACSDSGGLPDLSDGGAGEIGAESRAIDCSAPLGVPFADVDVDGQVGAADIAVIERHLGRRTSFFNGDANDDGVVDDEDLQLAREQAGTDCRAHLPLRYHDRQDRLVIRLSTGGRRDFHLRSRSLFTVSELSQVIGDDDRVVADHRDEIPWFRCGVHDPPNRWDDQVDQTVVVDRYGKPIYAECARVEVPLDWSMPDGEKITLFVKHHGSPCDRQTGEGCGKSLWLLHGGPGGAGTSSVARGYVYSDPTMDVYSVDMRGTGRSSYLACPAQEAPGSPGGGYITDREWPACIASLDRDRLSHFTTSNQARDLGYLIDHVRALGQRVFTKGGSYGTYWTQRYLQIFPEQATGSVMTGVASAGPAGNGGENFARYMQQYEETVGKMIEQRCADDPVCSQRILGAPAKTKSAADVHAAMLAVLDDLGPTKTCPQVTDPAQYAGAHLFARKSLAEWFASTILYAIGDQWVLPFAVVYRLRRCNAEDVGALKHFAKRIQNFSRTAGASTMFSQVLNMHISLSEMWANPMPLEAAEAYAAKCIWCFGRVTRFRNVPWPIPYVKDEFIDKYADTRVPVLMLNGVFDPASPLEESAEFVRDNLKSPHKYFFAMPEVAHAGSAPARDKQGQLYDCERRIEAAFLSEPTAAPADCTAEVLPIDLGYDTQRETFAAPTCGNGSQPCGYDAWRNYVYR